MNTIQFKWSVSILVDNLLSLKLQAKACLQQRARTHAHAHLLRAHKLHWPIRVHPRCSEGVTLQPPTNTSWHICIVDLARLHPQTSWLSTVTASLLTKSKQTSLQLFCNLETREDKLKHPLPPFAVSWFLFVYKLQETSSTWTTQRKSSGEIEEEEGGGDDLTIQPVCGFLWRFFSSFFFLQGCKLTSPSIFL